MKLIRIATVLLGIALAAQAQPGGERVEAFAGSKVRIHLTTGRVLVGHLGHVSSGSVSLETAYGDTALAVNEIVTIGKLGFRDTPTVKFLRNAPGKLLEYPAGVLILGILCVDRLVTGRWPEGP